MTFAEILAFAIIWAVPLVGLVLLGNLLVLGIYAIGVWRGWWTPGPPTNSAGPR